MGFKKRISGAGILLMLLVKHPPLPQFSLFTRVTIVETRCFSLKRVALDFFLY